MNNKELPPIINIEETTSTNIYLNGLSSNEKLLEATVVSANFQSSGKGQRGNSWESEKEKNLLFSTILYPYFIPIGKQFLISQCVALAIRDVLSEYTGQIKIKWPNDIYWKNRKICGILIENKLEDDRISESVVGIGININQEQFECRPQPVSLRMIAGKEFDRIDILKKTIARILYYYEKIKSGEENEVVREYKKDLFSTGMFRDTKTNEIFEAQISDIESNGTLILTDKDGNSRFFLFKEVEFVMK
ncbi:biotin--[acetyl-CoA-carboxylase] ligase [Dysgonomonas sp. 520]|uniref:biotin--[acetyl-CoA-carboxylase] ligase n=1 Tax=Dysgonomonas sp. 520 TaxID=2302931 RepID=UPI0013D226E6|nr:biotin--[acetyl-CoA-carboxylase] ligase [Dysgonomonas sp. 520]NDW08348.1 biotin--[acetyl-CoA-carboxylase] ligase [Dysgonomonas sp. 520]